VRTLPKFLCLALLLCGQFLLAATLTSTKNTYYPADFYRQVESGAPENTLKEELFKILSSTHILHPGQHDTISASCSTGKSCVKHASLGYNTARRILFGELHLLQTPRGYAIRDLYCQRMITKDDFRQSPPGPGQIPDPVVMNAEHTWPQSRFSSRFQKDMQKSDLHILYPVLSVANSSRGNMEFGDVVTPLSSPCPLSERGYTARGGGKVYFEVPDSHKGNVARALFYFSIRYSLRIQREEEDSLKAWHRADPVDSEEAARNSAIFAKQMVRNPFIDHPELVELISDF